MKATIDCYFDFSSSYSYIGMHRMRRLAQSREVDLNWRPIALGAIFKALSHGPPDSGTPKGAYLRRDVERTAEFHGLPYVWPEPFPFNSIAAARAFHHLDADDGERAIEWALAVFDAAYAQGRDCSDPAQLAAVATDLGLDGQSLMNAAGSDEAKQRLRSETDAAMERGVFGAPTFFLDAEMYWGEDRIGQIERALEGGGA